MHSEQLSIFNIVSLIPMDVKVLFQYQLARFPKPQRNRPWWSSLEEENKNALILTETSKIESQNEDSWWVTGQENKYAMKYYFLF